MPRPPRAPSSPRPPSTPAAPRAPRLALAPIRSGESAQLDGQEVKSRGTAEPVAVPPFMYWPEFKALLGQLWRPGPPSWPNTHMAIVGATRSGKSTFTREIMRMRDYVCLFGTKNVDEPLYGPLLKQGYVIRERWNPENTEERRVIFKPPLTDTSAKAHAAQKEAFRQALDRVYQTGGWTLWFDEIRYLADDLGLARELNLLWLQGGSNGTTIVGLTQRPVSVPLNMFAQSRFLVTFRISGREDRRTMANYAGGLEPVLFETAAILPRYELLFIDSEEDLAVRTMVE